MELRGYQPTGGGWVQQVPGQNHRADLTDSYGDGLANADHVGVGRPMAKAASRCRLPTESGTDELLAQRP